MTELILIDALIRAARMFAGVSGALVFIDAIAVLMLHRECPPHSPKWNAIAWAVASSVVAVAALLLLLLGYVTAEGEYGKKIVGGLWMGLGLAFTVRAISRAQRGGMIALSAGLIFVTGTTLAVLDRLYG